MNNSRISKAGLVIVTAAVSIVRLFQRVFLVFYGATTRQPTEWLCNSRCGLGRVLFLVAATLSLHL